MSRGLPRLHPAAWVAIALGMAVAFGWLGGIGRPGTGGGAGGVERAAAADSAPFFAARDLAADPLWDDGHAEFSVYRGVQPRYGHDRPLDVRVIVVKEDMNSSLRVKSDPGPVPGKTEEVLKVNYVHDFPTGIYAYHQMASVFYRRTDMAPRKLAMSSTESCGITFLEWLPQRDRWRHISHSYWDNESDRDFSVTVHPEGPPAVMWDGLYLWLRTLDLARPQRFAVRLLPGQVSSRVTATALVGATVEVGASADGLVPVTVAYPDRDGRPRTDAYRFRAAWPHVMERLERGDGVSLELVKTMRLAYWRAHDPGDERLLEPGVEPPGSSAGGPAGAAAD